jgi:hypothetical protein
MSMIPVEIGPNQWIYRCASCKQKEYPNIPVSKEHLAKLAPPYHDCPRSNEPNMKAILEKQDH